MTTTTAVALEFSIEDIDNRMMLTINAQNAKGHWHRKACVDYWHGKVVEALEDHSILPVILAKAKVDIYFRHQDNRRRDTGNLYPVAKAIVDALVEKFGILPDDDDAHLIGPHLWAEEERGPRRVTVIVKEVD